MREEQDTESGKPSPPRPLITLAVLWKGVLIIIAIIGALYAFDAFLDRKIEAKLSDPAFLLQLAKSQRPSIVFDENGTVLSDFGARKLLRLFDVSVAEDKKAYKKTVVVRISPVEFLGVNPLVESLDTPASIKVTRGKDLDWLIEIQPPTFLVTEGSPKQGPLRFRLEILR